MNPENPEVSLTLENESLRRTLPEGNESVSYCCEAASQILAADLPEELPFDE